MLTTLTSPVMERDQAPLTRGRGGQVAHAASANRPFRAGRPGRARHTMPGMGRDEGIWFELQTESRPTGRAERYRDRAAAEQAATAMLIRQPELQFVDVTEYGTRDGRPLEARVVNRITSAHPPAPAEAAVDDLHRLPRGDPEC